MNSGFYFEPGMPLFTMKGQDIPVILAVTIAAMALEVFLALKKDGRLGLVLPGLWLLQTLVRLAVRAVQVDRTIQDIGSAWLANPGQALALAFAVENIPTLMLLAAYGLCRACKRWRTRQQLEKTRIEDL